MTARALKVVSILIVSWTALAVTACARGDREPDDSAQVAEATRDTSAACPADNGGITLPPGFCATVFADSVGHARHMAITPDGIVYVNTWSGRYYGNAPPPRGGFLVALRDTTGDGVADMKARFGDSIQNGGIGGTGIALHRGALFAEANDKIVRYELRSAGATPTAAPTIIVSRLPLTGDHPAHPFAIDSSGTLFVNSGSATNACGIRDRTPESRGHDPCTELRTRAGIWRYDANRTRQTFSPAERHATGIRNAIGLTIGPNGALYATQHGRDQLAESWPKLYTPQQGQDLPAEELLSSSKAGTMAGRTATTTIPNGSSCRRPNTAVTGPTSADAHRRVAHSRHSPLTGRLTGWCFTRATAFRHDTAAVPSSPFTVRGIVPPAHKAVTTWCSFRFPAAIHPARTRRSPMGSPAPRNPRTGPRIARRVWP